MSTIVLPSELENIVMALCQDVATPVSLTVAKLIEAREYDQIAVKQVDPSDYTNPHAYKLDVTIVDLLRKCESLPTSFDRKAVAVENFYKCERECYRTNERLSSYFGSIHIESSDLAERIIVRARKKIAQILGAPPRSLEGRFGPGSTYGDKGVYTTIPDKMTSRPTLTLEAMSMIPLWGQTAWARCTSELKRQLELSRGNRFTTVPKDAKKHRGIAVEPSVNLFYQLGLGRVLRKALKKAGINLLVAQEIHKRVACEGSIKGHIATIDLSNASDTISYNLVKLLLPSAWFTVFDQLRSPRTSVDGKWVLLEKFSSMGNGYTFELETLLFLAIGAAVLEEKGLPCSPGVDIHVYGDDIIVPTSAALDVIATLQFFGMTANKDKTFTSGPFRESCGGDFFDGVAVRPYYLKEFPNEPQDYIAMANGIRALAYSDSFSNHSDAHLKRAWFRILDAIPSDVRRLRGPKDLGDLVIHDHHERWQTRWRGGIRYIGCWRPARFMKIGWDHFHDCTKLATALYGSTISADRIGADGEIRQYREEGVMPRDAVLGHKRGWVPFS